MASICQNCKNSITERTKFCRMCGTPVTIVSNQNVANKDSFDDKNQETLLPKTEVLASSPKTKSASVKQLALSNLSIKKAENISVAQVLENPLSNQSFAPASHALIGLFEQAGFGLRMAASMLDILLVLLLVLVTSILANSVDVYQNIIEKLSWLAIIIAWSINFLVFPISTGQTVGKWLVGIRIISTNQQRAKPSQIIIRHLFGYFVSILPISLGLLWIIWDKKQQGWHDKLANTLVIRKRFNW